MFKKKKEKKVQDKFVGGVYHFLINKTNLIQSSLPAIIRNKDKEEDKERGSGRGSGREGIFIWSY